MTAKPSTGFNRQLREADEDYKRRLAAREQRQAEIREAQYGAAFCEWCGRPSNGRFCTPCGHHSPQIGEVIRRTQGQPAD